MDRDEWVRRCADRLQEQWPHANREDLEDTASELFADERRRRFAPEVAAIAWLRLGVLAT